MKKLVALIWGKNRQMSQVEFCDSRGGVCDDRCRAQRRKDAAVDRWLAGRTHLI